MGKTIGTILVVALLVLVGFWLFNSGDGDVALDGNENATSTELDLTGTGGLDEGEEDPLDMDDGETFLDEDGDGYDDNTGELIIPDKG